MHVQSENTVTLSLYLQSLKSLVEAKLRGEKTSLIPKVFSV